jgi:hypothetical protein
MKMVNLAKVIGYFKDQACCREDAIIDIVRGTKRYKEGCGVFNEALSKLQETDPELSDKLGCGNTAYLALSGEIEYVMGLFDGAMLYHLLTNVLNDE